MNVPSGNRREHWAALQMPALSTPSALLQVEPSTLQ
jgi:hypothetical protein